MSGSLLWISSGAASEVWGVNNDGKIWKREGVTSANPKGSGWKQVPGELMKANIWAGQVWGVNTKDQIFYMNI